MKVYVVTEMHEHGSYGDIERVSVFARKPAAELYCLARMSELEKDYRTTYGNDYMVEKGGFRIRPNDNVGDVDDRTLAIDEEEVRQ